MNYHSHTEIALHHGGFLPRFKRNSSDMCSIFLHTFYIWLDNWYFRNTLVIGDKKNKKTSMTGSKHLSGVTCGLGNGWVWVNEK